MGTEISETMTKKRAILIAERSAIIMLEWTIHAREVTG
jgi:hypothetical protein